MATPAKGTPSHPAHATATAPEASKDNDGDHPLDVNVLKELARRALIDALNSVNGAKTLVLDPSLAGPLGLVTEVSLLKQHGVDKMFWLEAGTLNATTTNVVYLCRPQIKWMKIVAEQIKGLVGGPTPHNFTLFLVPRRTTLCDRILEEEGVFGEVTISSYKLEFIPLEDDLISLEWESTYREIFLDGDDTAIYYAAQALLTIEQAYGLFPRILGKGTAAKKLSSLLARLRPSLSSRAQSNLATPSDTIDSLVIIDRSTDMVTPMLTPLTYEGLIDEFIGIRNSNIEVDPALLVVSQTPAAASTSLPATTTTTKKKKHHLTAANDTVFAKLRDLNFAVVGGELNREAKRLDAELKARHQAQTVTQLKDFVGKLGGLQNESLSLKLHISLVDELTPLTRTDQFNKGLEIQQNLLASYDPSAQITAIEDLLAQEAPVQLILRLLCLASLTANGIKVKVLEGLKRDILQTYGYGLLPVLISLASLSLLVPSPLPKGSVAPPPFPPIRKAFRLLSDTTEASPTDISFVYSGYAPLSVRLVQCVAQKGSVLASAADGTKTQERTAAHPIVGWKGFEDGLKSIPGATVDDIQKGDASDIKSSTLPRDRTSTTLVFFLGGCTFTEISAIRWMATQTRGRRYLIATTGIVNGSTLIESLAASGTKFAPQI